MQCGGIMCGIVGAICRWHCERLTLDSLKKIEYRGYDSAGICLKNKCQMHIYKTEGYIEKLDGIVPSSLAPVAISHTRWATHGKVSKENAHPISSEDGVWTIVHNGIIENFDELKSMLLAKGVKFSTQTDSEVICALLALETFSNPIKNIMWVVKKLKGSFAFCAVKKDTENAIYAARQGSPLYAYLRNGKAMIASDPICFFGDRYYKFEDGEICKLTQQSIDFYAFSGKKLKKSEIFNEKIQFSAEKGDYSHFMLKEIYETPQTLLNLARQYQKLDLSILGKLKFNKIKLIGCGTAYHSCLMGASFMRTFLKVDAEALQASEFRYGNYIIDAQTLCIFISQSGETADTIAAYKRAEQKTKNLISLTNVPHSTLASMSGVCLPICAGPEIAVASTKAYSNQVAALFVLTKALKSKQDFWGAIRNVVELSKKLQKFDVDMKGVAQKICGLDKIFFIGRGEDYVTAQEGALKLKEISYINCSAFAAGELKHGSLALVEDGTPVFVIANDEKVFEKTMNSAFEAKSRGAKLFLVSSLSPKQSEADNFEDIILLPKCGKSLANIMAVVPLQLLSYWTCIFKNLNPDKPRNLAKSVTVE